MSAYPIFPDSPELRLHDPLGELLGVGDGIYSYTFDDVAKLAGHACPTVAGGFLLVKRALELLYGDKLPQRGDLRVTLFGEPGQGTNGPMSQVLTLLTGAAADNGFHGLAGKFVRNGLLSYGPPEPSGPVRYRFERISSGEAVTLIYDPNDIPPSSTMGEDLGFVLSGTADQETTNRFRDAWGDRVRRILRDGGKRTVHQVE